MICRCVCRADHAQILEKIDPRQRHSLTEQAFYNMKRQYSGADMTNETTKALLMIC
jgi:hypothetical protein